MQATTPKPRPFKFQWQQTIQDAKNEYEQNKFPQYFQANGETRGKWEDQTANGLTRAIVDYLNFKAGNFTRVNVMGTPRKNKAGRLIFTPSTTKKGTADIVGVMKGRYIAIEVKIGADVQSANQIQEQKDVSSAGGMYIIARNMQSFLNIFSELKF